MIDPLDPPWLRLSGSGLLIPGRRLWGGLGGECCDQGDGEPCNKCTSTPSQFQVVFSGWADTGACSECDETLDGTFVCDQVPGNDCIWRYVIGTVCGSSGWKVEVQLLTNQIIVVIEDSTAFWANTFTKTITTPYDCAGISGLDIPHTNSIGCDCNGGSATCTLTAL